MISASPFLLRRFGGQGPAFDAALGERGGCRFGLCSSRCRMTDSPEFPIESLRNSLLLGQKGRGPCVFPTVEVLAKGTASHCGCIQGHSRVRRLLTHHQALCSAGAAKARSWGCPFRPQSQVQWFGSEGIQLSLVWTPGRAEKNLSAPKLLPCAQPRCFFPGTTVLSPIIVTSLRQQLKLQNLGLSFYFNQAFD